MSASRDGLAITTCNMFPPAATPAPFSSLLYPGKLIDMLQKSHSLIILSPYNLNIINANS